MKKIILLIGLLVIVLFLSGCGEQQITCNKPYLLVGTECCLDRDDNSICDKDEVNEDISKDASDLEIRKIALEFARIWEKEDYGQLYDYFTPELQAKKEKSEFVRVLSHARDMEGVVTVRLDGVEILSEDKALTYFHVNGFSYFSYVSAGAELPAFDMVLVNGGWKFDAFAGFFDAECVFDSDCPYTRECKIKCENDILSTLKGGVSKN